MSEKFILNAVYFNRAEDDRIEYVTIDPNTFEGQYRNSVSTVRFNGVEVGFSSKPAKDFTLDANYTLTNSKEGLALRVPKNKVNVSLGYSIGVKSYVGLTYQYISDRTDTDFATFSEVTLGSFSLANLQLKHDFSNRFGAFIAVDNILNEEYTELVDYTTKGRNLRLGFKISL